MKIAVTSQNFRTVTPHAGRARRFLVYEARPGEEPVEIERLDLPKEMSLHEFHGEGAHPLDGVDVVVSRLFGEGFARRMADRGIVAVATNASDPVVAVKEYLQSCRTGLVGQPVLERLRRRTRAGANHPRHGEHGCEGRHGHAG
jgi:predicted Fe-Mo cluster-binding NifX family protein